MMDCGITGLRKAEKMSMTMLVLVDDNIETVEKIILGNRCIIIREVIDDVGISFGLC